MNHTERIAEAARRHRILTNRVARLAVEEYLALLADELAAGETVELHGVGKLQVRIEAGSGSDGLGGYRRLRTSVRLGERFKERCYQD